MPGQSNQRPTLLPGGLAASQQPELSIVVPAHNEEPSLAQLTGRVRDTLDREGITFEIVIVDDGSSDGTAATLHRLRSEDPRFRSRVLSFRHGKSAALDCGFKAARGRVIVTMDGDLQDLPEEIPTMLRALEEQELDLVQGWRKHREDKAFKIFASWVFNSLCSRFSGLRTRDVNCGFKAMRSEVVNDLKLGDDMHRFIPLLAHRRGYRVGEVPVRHARRAFGRSKYGPLRYLRGLNDLIVIALLPRLLRNASPLLGPLGVLCIAMAVALCGLVVFLGATQRLGQLWELGLSSLLLLGIGGLCFALSYLNRMRFTQEQAHHALQPDVSEIID